MSIQISVKRGTVDPTSASGLTLAEPVFNINNNTFWIGKGSGVTPIWIGAGVCGASAGIAAGITYQIPTLGAVKDYISSIGTIGATGATGSQGVQGATGATGPVGDYVVSFNGSTGAVTFSNYAASVNGLTGAIVGVGFTSGKLSQFASTTSAELAGIISDETGSGVLVFGTSPSITTALNTASASFNLLTTNATSLFIGNAATTGRLFGYTGTLAGTQSVTVAGANTGVGVNKTVSIGTGSGLNGSVTINIGQAPDEGTGTINLLSNTAVTGTLSTTGNITAPNIVTAFNGNTGAVTGASLGANTFTGLNTFSAGISAAGATFGATVTIAGGTAWHSLNDGATSGLDAGLIHGVCGARFLENLQTGLLYGGLISVNAGNTAQVDITAGAAIIVSPGASLSAYPIPTVTPVTWTAKTGVTLSGLTSSDETWLAIDSSGSLIQTNAAFTDAQYASQIPLGAALHLSRTYIQLIKTYPHVSYAQAEQFDPFIRAFGNLKLLGHEVTANGANLTVNRSAGKAYAMGRNYKNDPNNPNIVTDTSALPVTTVYHFYRNGSGGFTTTINGQIHPGSLDDGTGTLGTVTPAKYTIQRIFYLPDQPTLLGVYYGRQEYNSISDAQANIPYEEFSESESTATQGIFCGWLIVQGNATALNNTAQAKFVNAGLFRNTANIGGGGLAIASIDDLNDVTTTTPTNNQVLRWNSGTSQWVNSDVSSLAVSSFNGLTGAVTGVSSWNGSTGAVTFTNYVASFNGLTGAVQGVSAAVAGTGIAVSGATGSVTITNTGVQSFNGITGAVTGVTVGGANIFTALNSFNAGISAAGGVTLSGTFAGTTGAFSKLLSASAGISAGGNVVFNAVTTVFGASAANTTPITVYKDNSSDNPAVDDGFGNTSFDTPNNKVPLTLSFTEVYDPNTGLTASTPGSTMIRVRDQTAGSDTFTVTDSGNIVCGSIVCSSITPTAYSGNLSIDAGNAITLNWDGTLPAPTVLSVYNTDTSANTLTLTGAGTFSQLTTSGALQYGAVAALNDSYTMTTTSTGATTMFSFTKTAYRSFEFDVQGSRGTTGPYQFTKILAVHDGTTVTATQTSNISTVGVTVGTYTVDISGTLVRLRVTPGATASTVFKAVVKAIPA